MENKIEIILDNQGLPILIFGTTPSQFLPVYAPDISEAFPDALIEDGFILIDRVML